MRDVNLMIGDGDPVSLKRSIDVLSGMKGIRVLGGTTDGAELIEAVRKRNVDIVLTGLMLKRVDGFGVLEAIGYMTGHRPKALVLSNINRDELIRRAYALGATYCMLKPASADLICRRIIDFADSEERFETGEDNDLEVRMRVSRALDEIGISPALKARRYLEEAVILLSKDEMLGKNLTGRLYPRIALTFGVTPESVERSMRTAINSAWKAGGFLRYRVTTGDATFTREKPSSGRLIESLVKRAAQEMYVN